MTESRSQAEWTRIFDRIGAALTKALAHASDVLPSTAPITAEQDPLTPLALSLGNVQACLERAEKCAAETDALLQTEAARIKDWTVAAKAARDKLDKLGERAA